MKIAEAIRKARILRDTEIPDDTMLGWLSSIDGIVWEETVRKYERPPGKPEYGPDTDLEETELMIRAPWDEMYPHFLAMKIDLEHGDFERYNNEADSYQAIRQAWANNYNKTHRWASTEQYREPRPRYYDTQILF